MLQRKTDADLLQGFGQVTGLADVSRGVTLRYLHDQPRRVESALVAFRFEPDRRGLIDDGLTRHLDEDAVRIVLLAEVERRLDDPAIDALHHVGSLGSGQKLRRQY